MSRRILIVEDEAPIRDMLCFVLEQNGYQASTAADFDSAINQLVEPYPDLVLLDWMLPGGSGIQIAKKMKQHELTRSIPIIMITARGEEEDKVRGLEVGADDYVTKPFNPRELLARVKSLLRRTAGARPVAGEDLFAFAGWALNLPRRRLTDPQGHEVVLTRGEFELLAILVRHACEVINRDRLSRAVSGHDWSPDDRSVDVLVRRLRAKLDAPERPDSLIATVRGEGYRLAVEAKRVSA